MGPSTGMPCRELVELVTDYLEDRLSPIDRARFEAHLTECEACRTYLEQFRQTIRVLGRLPEESQRLIEVDWVFIWSTLRPTIWDMAAPKERTRTTTAVTRDTNMTAPKQTGCGSLCIGSLNRSQYARSAGVHKA